MSLLWGLCHTRVTFKVSLVNRDPTRGFCFEVNMKDAYYFPHDCNAIQDPKMMTLLTECGLIGIGAFWVLIEILHQQQCGGIGIAQLRSYMTFYGKQGMWDQSILDRCEKVLFETGLLFEKDGMVYSHRVINNLKRRSEISESGRQNAIKRWVPNATPMRPHSEPNAIKEKERKVNKDISIEAEKDPASQPEAYLSFPTNGKTKEWVLSKQRFLQLKELYPAADVGLELKKARDWCIREPMRRKTVNGMERFLATWLSKAQNGSRVSVQKEERVVI